MHLKRQAIPKNWPVSRKETKYVVKPSSNHEMGLPVLIVLRDLLGLAQNRKEVKRAIFQKKILVNAYPVRNEERGVLLFDTITIVPMKKAYRLTMGTNGKFKVEEISVEDAGKKIVKVSDKKALKGKRTQLNFNDGKNLISDVKCKTHDSAIIDLAGKKVEKIIPFAEKAKVFIYSGKHTGQTGSVVQIDEKSKAAKVNFGERTVNVLIKQLIVVE